MHSIYISEVIEKQEPAAQIYIPTPKHILEARKAQNSSERSSEPPDKKKRLEYVPESKTNTAYPTPTYIPSKLNADATNIVEGSTNGQNGDDITGLLSELASEQPLNDGNHSENVPEHDVKDIEKTKSSSTSRHRHSSHKSSRSQSSRSHSDRDRKSSSSKSSHRSSSSSNKSKHSDKSKPSDKSSSKHRSERKSSSSSSSSSSKRRRSSSHSSKSSQKKE